MSENTVTKAESIQLLLELNHDVSHDLQAILFLIGETNQMTDENRMLLMRHVQEVVNKYSRFRESSYALIGIEVENENKAEPVSSNNIA